jgi:hypothetical protein
MFPLSNAGRVGPAAQYKEHLPMRLSVWLALAGVLVPANSTQARLFRQTYGATVPTADGGSVWNINQDYFVPRHCDSCRYDLFSACKQSHTRSPACKYLHPVYEGYCTPYGPCRYKWRDHVYKKYCGSTPLRHTYGGWHLEKCRKHSLVTRKDCACDGVWRAGNHPVGGQLAMDNGYDAGEFAAHGMYADDAGFAYVESMEVETLGTLAAAGEVAAMMPGASSASAPAASASPAPFPMGLLPGTSGGLMGLPSPGVN